MKHAIILTILIIFASGCSILKPSKTNTISGTQELLLDAQDLQELGMVADQLKQLAELGLETDGGDCKNEAYNTSEFSPLAEYSICSYIIASQDDTEVIIEFKKFTNSNDLNGTYQYESLHYRSSDGLLSEDDYGDQSRFYLNNENDYGGEFNDPNVYYYTLYFTKDEYLVHVTSKGRTKEAEQSIAKIGRKILSKFG